MIIVSAIGIGNTDRIGCIDPDGLNVQIPVTGQRFPNVDDPANVEYSQSNDISGV